MAAPLIPILASALARFGSEAAGELAGEAIGESLFPEKPEGLRSMIEDPSTPFNKKLPILAAAGIKTASLADRYKGAVERIVETVRANKLTSEQMKEYVKRISENFGVDESKLSKVALDEANKLNLGDALATVADKPKLLEKGMDKVARKRGAGVYKDIAREIEAKRLSEVPQGKGVLVEQPPRTVAGVPPEIKGDPNKPRYNVQKDSNYVFIDDRKPGPRNLDEKFIYDPDAIETKGTVIDPEWKKNAMREPEFKPVKDKSWMRDIEMDYLADAENKARNYVAKADELKKEKGLFSAIDEAMNRKVPEVEDIPVIPIEKRLPPLPVEEVAKESKELAEKAELENIVRGMGEDTSKALDEIKDDIKLGDNAAELAKQAIVNDDPSMFTRGINWASKNKVKTLASIGGLGTILGAIALASRKNVADLVDVKDGKLVPKTQDREARNSIMNLNRELEQIRKDREEYYKGRR